PAAVLVVRDKGDSGLTRVSSWGLAPAQGLQSLPADAGLAGEVMADGRARRFANPGGDPASAGLPPQLPALQHGLIASLCSPRHAYGWVLLMDKLGADGFSAEDEHLLSIYAAQAGRIYENGSLYKKIMRTAEQLQLANETLEQRVLQRTAELHDVIEGLESFNRGVSHDLRGPLGGIANAARLAQEFIASHDSERALRFLQVIAAQAETTRQLVDALLALARASDASLSRERVDMHALAIEVVESLQRLPGDAPLPVVVEPLATVQADRKLVRQVLVNLIGNALKFSAGAARPQVRVGMDASGRTPVFFVRDNGVGFDAGRAQQLFKPFQRLHDAGFEGSGVGLSIVRKIVERHGGRVWADSEPGQGATFHFSLGAAAG
ncbi:MAG TPA: GAF domain-containing sensor histidine kinase, partial [Roseateles sp.]